MMTGCPRLSDSFCPKTRAMMSLPPPGVNPTTMRIGRFGYSAWARGGARAKKFKQKAASSTRQMVFTTFPPKQLLRECSSARRTKFGPLQRRDLDMQDGCDPAVDSGEAGTDGRSEVIRLADEFTVRPECAADIGEVSLLALPARAQL